MADSTREQTLASLKLDEEKHVAEGAGGASAPAASVEERAGEKDDKETKRRNRKREKPLPPPAPAGDDSSDDEVFWKNFKKQFKRNAMSHVFGAAVSSPTEPPRTEESQSNYDVLSSLKKYGFGSLDNKLYPDSKHVSHVRTATESVRKATGVKQPFICLDVKSKLFADKHQGDERSDPAPQSSDDKKKFAYISHSHLFSFLHKNVVLAAVTGFCDSHGGPGSFCSYIMQLFFHCSGERISVIVETDFAIRSHLARMSAAGQAFDVAVEAEKNISHFLSI